MAGSMSNNKILSVVIPIYNEEKFLNECISSVVNQTYPFLDIILVDDGSTDNSGMLCDEWVKRDSRIRVIHQENKGMIGARKTGLLLSEGEYSIFIDADDFIDLSAYKEMMDIALAYNADIVTSGCYRYWDDDNKRQDICSRVDEGLYDNKQEIAAKIYPIMLWEEKTNTWAIDPSLCMKVVKKKYLLEQYSNISGQSFSYGEDSAIIYPALLNMDRIYITHNCYYYHRQRNNSVISPYVASKSFPNNLYNFYKYLYSIFSATSYADCLIKQLDMFYVKSASMLMRRYTVTKPNSIKKPVTLGKRIWIFPFDIIPKGKKVVIYGAGTIGTQYYKQVLVSNYCKRLLLVDKNYNQMENVTNPSSASFEEYDYLVIAVKDDETNKMIKQKYIENGWSETAIIIPDFDRTVINV